MSYGFDYVFNYKTVNFSEEISRVAPDGVDVFFDNVGGEFFHIVMLKHMKRFRRVSLSGSIDNYNDKEQKLYPAINFACVRNELSVRGFLAWSWKSKWPEAFVEMKQYIKEGKLKVRDIVYEGFDNMRHALYGLFTGDNTGKAVVKV